MINSLIKARTYEKESKKEELKKPRFHVCAPIGWLNDPNGFSIYGGEYHLFYQYYPYSMQWGPMHWGHVKSKDFITWEYLPCALAPDKNYDQDGCFSGSAIEWNGKHLIAYTGVEEIMDEEGNRVTRQTQCIAVGDGLNYEKLEINPVVTTDMIPEGSSLEDFRDPKLFIKGESLYFVIGSRADDGSGQILLYKSKDAKIWEFISILDQSNNELGKMWECPDYFDLDSEKILIISPQEMQSTNEFHNGHCSLGIIGTEVDNKFQRKHTHSLDYGLDFYAPQTMETEDGRRIMVAWLQSWDNHFYPGQLKWSGMMSIPRELTIRNNRICQSPVREIENYYGSDIYHEKYEISHEIAIDEIQGRYGDLQIEFENELKADFTVKVAAGNDYYSFIKYHQAENEIEISRENSGLTRDIIMSRRHKLNTTQTVKNIRIILDRYSVEVFINHGEMVFSMLIFTDDNAHGIRFSAKEKTVADIRFHTIEK